MSKIEHVSPGFKLLSKIDKDTLFGGTKQVDTLNPQQRALLEQMSNLQQQYNPQTLATLAQIGYTPQSAYKYNQQTMQDAFNAGIVNPALDQLNRQIANTQHSSMLHSSANRIAQDRLREGVLNNLNNLNWQNLLQQQQLEQQAQENAYQRQLSSLSQLLGGNSQILGTQATALTKKPGLLDMATGVAGLAKTGAEIYKML